MASAGVEALVQSLMPSTFQRVKPGDLEVNITV